MANPNPAPFMTGSTTVVRDPSPSDLRNVSQPGESVPDPNFEFQYVLTGYPDTQIEVDVLRDGKSLGQFTLNSKTPSVMVTQSGPKLSADFTKLELSYTDYYYTEGGLFSTTTGTIAVWQVATQEVAQAMTYVDSFTTTLTAAVVEVETSTSVVDVGSIV